MIVVTGATGHIGNVTVRELLARGQKNIRAVIPPFEDTSPLTGLDIDIATADIRDYDSLFSAFEGAEYVYHLAGIVSIGSGKSRLLHEVNVKGTRNVVEACMNLNVRRLVYVSSIHAFVEPPAGTPITETKVFDPARVVGEYAKSKAAATIEVLKGIEQGLDAVIVHPTGVIGPYQYRLTHMGQLIVDFMNGRLFAYIDGAYDFVDVRDVAKGVILACEKGQRGENYILSGQRISVKEILDILAEETGMKAPKMKIPFRLAKLLSPLAEMYYSLARQKPLFTAYSIYTLSSNSVTSHDKASRELGYMARPVWESIIDTVRWLKQVGKANPV